MIKKNNLETKIITVGQLRIAHSLAKLYVNNKSKFGYACLRGCEKIESILKKFDNELKDKQNELASVDEKGNLIISNDNLSYSKEANKKLSDFLEEQNKKEVSGFEPYFATDISSVKDNMALLSKLNGIIVNVDIEKLYQ